MDRFYQPSRNLYRILILGERGVGKTEFLEELAHKVDLEKIQYDIEGLMFDAYVFPYSNTYLELIPVPNKSSYIKVIETTYIDVDLCAIFYNSKIPEFNMLDYRGDIFSEKWEEIALNADQRRKVYYFDLGTQPVGDIVEIMFFLIRD